MPPFYGTGLFVWEVTLLVSGGSPTINQAANTLAAPPSGGCELDNGLVVNFAGALAGNVYVYWR